MQRWPSILLHRLRSLFRRTTVDRDLDKELRFHIDEQVEELVTSGMPRAEARRQAMREFGSAASIEQQCRETRRVLFVENLLQDLRYGSRVLLKQPTLVIVAAASIALGVGANLTIFSLANSLLLSIPTASRPDRVIHIRAYRGSHASYRMWHALEASGVVSGVAGYNLESDVNWRTREGTESLMPLVVSANFFDVMGVPLFLGRGFTAGEAAAERDPRVAVVTYRFWSARLGRDPNVIGSSLVVNGVPFTVLGVLTADLRSLPGFGIAPDLWLPMSRALAPDLASPTASHFQLIGRLHDGQSVAAAWAALDTVAAREAGTDAPAGAGSIKYVAPVGSMYQLNEFKEVTVFFGGLIVVTWLVLGIACANVAGLLLARSAARQKEIAMRLAIGASRRRLIQQLLTEGFLLSVIGAAAGFALTLVMAQLIERVSLPLPFPLAISIAFDDRLLAVAAALVVTSTVLCAMAPALHATRPDVMPSLKLDNRSHGHRRFNLRGVMVGGQVAVSVVLLVMTVLFLRNLTLARTADPGFDVDRILVSNLTFVEGRQGNAQQAAAEVIAARLRVVPGVEAAAFADGVPLTLRNGGTTGTRMRIDGIDGMVRVDYDGNRVGPDYFRVMGIGLLRGRDFTAADRQGAPPVAIVNEEFARRYFNGLEPIGRGIDLHGPTESVRTEVIGVVANSKYTTIGEERDAAVYTPYLMGASPDRLVHLLVRTTAPPSSMIPAVRDTISHIDPDAANVIEPLEAALTFAFLPSRIGAVLVGALGILGVVLAMIGLYGVISFAVTRRTPEIGIRLALGSTNRGIARVVFTDAAVLVGAGLVAGVGLAWLITRALTAVLVSGLSTTDPASFVATVVIMALTSALAIWGPTRRAMRIEPAVTLRAD